MAMPDNESQRQIQQMINFILNEARDKAQEIEAKAIEDFNIEKLKLVQQMKHKLRQEYQQKTKKMETERSIARSNAANKARLKKMEAKCAFVDQVIKDASSNLLKIVDKKNQYKTICVDLITQGLLRLLEDSVYVRCRPEDESMIKECCALAKDKYHSILRKEANSNKTVTVLIDTQNYLPSGPSSSKEGVLTCSGGVVLSSMDRKTVLDNTFDARLEIVAIDSLPAFRLILFPGS